MTGDSEFGSKMSSTTESAKNSIVSSTWLKMLRLVAMVIMVIIKWSKNYLFKKLKVLTGNVTSLRLRKR